MRSKLVRSHVPILTEATLPQQVQSLPRSVPAAEIPKRIVRVQSYRSLDHDTSDWRLHQELQPARHNWDVRTAVRTGGPNRVRHRTLLQTICLERTVDPAEIHAPGYQPTPIR